MKEKAKTKLGYNILWRDKKRILGLPISFTKYIVDEDRLYLQTGFLNTENNEVLLYRILDVKSSQSFGQKIFGVGTVILISADQTNRELKLENVKEHVKVHKFLSEIVERERTQKGIAGREVFGAASVNMAHLEHCCDPDSNITFEEF